MSNKASAGYLPAPQETPLTTKVLCRKLLPDRLGSSLASLAGLASLEAMTVSKRNCFSRGFGKEDWASTNRVCTGLWLQSGCFNWAGGGGSERDNRSHCLPGSSATHCFQGN